MGSVTLSLSSATPSSEPADPRTEHLGRHHCSAGRFSIVISQPRFEIIPVTEVDIDAWFSAQGFQKIASASYYREEDNLGVFDAHDKNVLRSHLYPEVLIPFDVIPCHPDPSFLNFIESAIAKNRELQTVRTTHTSDRT